MTRPMFNFAETLRALSRAAILVGALFVPLALAQTVMAGPGAIIEDRSNISSGAGLVLVISLQRA